MKGQISYVEVADETLHKEIYRSDFFRVYRALLAPGVCTDFHRHSMNTVYFVRKGGLVATELMKGTPSCPTVLSESVSPVQRLFLLLQKVFKKYLNLRDGFLFFMPSKSHPVIHRARASRNNRTSLDLLGIEILFSGDCPFRAPAKDGRLEIDADDFAVYRFNLKMRQELDAENFSENGVLLIITGKLKITDQHDRPSFFLAGDIFRVNRNSIQRIDVEGANDLQFLYFLFKNTVA